MPELPEVETTKSGIAPHVVSDRVTEIIIRQSQLRWPITDNLATILTGQTLTHIERWAKYLLLHFQGADSGVLMIHLGMSGSLCIAESGSEPGKHSHVDICFAKGTVLRYTDPRRFGCILWLGAQPHEHKLLKALGPEPLSDAFSGAYLKQLAGNKSQAVKQFIMDQKVVTGVGNIYATEALFAAGIHPKRMAKSISLTRYDSLTQHIKTILSNAIAQGGTTLKDFVGGDGKPGYFKQELLAYGRKGDPCVQCQTPLQEIKLGNRATVFCQKCQS